MKLPPHVRIMAGSADARIYGVAYADRDLIKRLPRADRWWSRTLGCWITPVGALDVVRARLEVEAGYEVTVIDVSQLPAPRDWHARYREVIGEACPHRKKRQKSAERLATTEIQELGAAA